jgi:hypothetical protein
MGRAAPPLAACAALVVYQAINGSFSADRAFVTLARRARTSPRLSPAATRTIDRALRPRPLTAASSCTL